MARCFLANSGIIYHLCRQMEMIGSAETRTSLHGCKPLLSNDDIVHIGNLTHQQPDITIDEIMDTLHLNRMSMMKPSGKLF